MRRLMATAVLSLTLLGAAACSGEPVEQATATPSAGTSAAPAASSAASAVPTGTKDKAATCAAFTELSFSTGVAVLAATGKIVGAALDDPEKARPILERR